MNEKNYRLADARVLFVPAEAADKLLAGGDGTCALLYLYMLRGGGELVPAKAARGLGRTESEIRAAAEKLSRQGLLSGDAARFPDPPDVLPAYDGTDITARSREDSSFQALTQEAQCVMGHALSTPDLSTLLGIYDRLGMSPDTVMLLIRHCADKLRRRYGEGRLPTMRMIEKEAFAWARREIVTHEQAEEYLAALERLDAESEKLRTALQITGREPTHTEREYMDKWLAMGYKTEALLLAYDRTVTSTGRLAWAYMNKIVLSWYEKGLFTPEEIEKGDSRAPSRDRSAAAKSGERRDFSGNDDLGSLEESLKGTR